MISIYSENLPEGWRWTPLEYKGGTPEFCIETAGALKILGEDVIVYYDGEAMEFEDINFLPRELYDGGEIVIAQNSRPPIMGDKNIYWTSLYHDRAKDYMDFDKRVTLSKFHQNIFGDSQIVPLACWPDKLKPDKKENYCLFSSSPDRGFHYLREIWPEVYKETGYTLKASYGALCGETGIHTGEFTDEEMNELYRKAKFWLHPGLGIELFCISAYKAQVAGCIPVVSPNMALDETVKFGIKTSNFKNDLIKAIKNPPEVPEMKYKDWVDVTRELLQF